MRQTTLAVMTGFEQYGKRTRRALFLEEMERVVPWRELCALVEPHYPKPGNGRPPVGVERRLRIYFLQPWVNISDPAVDEALVASVWHAQSVGVARGRRPGPGATRACEARWRGRAAACGRAGRMGGGRRCGSDGRARS